MLTIEQLPVEILIKIFEYLPRYDDVMLVNRYFYDIACKIHDANFCLVLHSEFFEKKYGEATKSMRNTNRKITRVRIELDDTYNKKRLQSAIGIVKKFSDSIQYLSFEGCHMTMSDFLGILSLVPNAIHLYLGCIYLERDYRPPQKKRRLQHYNEDQEDLNLHKLKILKIYHSDEFVAVFNRVPAGVVLQLELNFSGSYNLHELKVLLKRQENIGKLKLNLSNCRSEVISNGMFDSLELDSFAFEQRNYNCDLATFLSKQKKLKYLNLTRQAVEEGVMNVVFNQLSELETLKINCSELPPTSVINTKKLKKLNKLFVSDESGTSPIFQTFARLDNSQITNFEIRIYYASVPLSLISALAISLPNLKVASFICYMERNVFNEILRNFNFVEVLRMNPLLTTWGAFDSDTNSFIQGDCVNKKLLELSIENKLPCDKTFLDKLGHCYPNLEKIVIASSLPIATPEFRHIFYCFPKLESLTLSGEVNLTADDLFWLNDHKNNLKIISIWEWKHTFIAEVKRKLSAMFGVVTLTDYGYLSMTVDRNTYERQNLDSFFWSSA